MTVKKKRYLPGAASGDMIFSYALTEPNTGSDARHIETRASLSADGRHYLLNGIKAYITNANYAGAMTVFAQMESERPGTMGAFIVETGWDGVTIGPDIPKMGLKASSTATVQFHNVKVPLENLIGKPGDGFKIAMTILNYGRLALGAASAGMMKRSLDDMKKRASARKQFGVPIHQFELIQEKMVKAEINATTVSAMTAFVTGMLAKDPLAPVAVESSHTKLFGTTRAWETLYDALQVAGGSGYLSTHPYEKRMREFRVTTIFEGTTEIHSIYPALFMIRKLSKKLTAIGSGSVAKTIFLLKYLLQKTDWPLRFDRSEMKRAAKTERSLIRHIRFLVLGGLLVYRKNIIHQEFLLRRISLLSVYFFVILAMLAKIQRRIKSSRPVTRQIDMLSLLCEQAQRYKKQNRHLLPDRSERLHKRIYHAIAANR